VRERMDAHSSLDYARRVAQALAGAAQHEGVALYGGLPDTRDRRFIEALPSWVLARS
jgi:geranylgeranyl diphosphate synthase, type II